MKYLQWALSRPTTTFGKRLNKIEYTHPKPKDKTNPGQQHFLPNDRTKFEI